MKKTKFTRYRKRVAKNFAQFFARPIVRRCYIWGALIVLLGTTVIWASLGASLHSTNADQLIDGYLFADKASFDGALFPSAHSMLFKWPLFWLVGILGTRGWPLLAATVLVSVVSVAGLAYLLARIERRPLVLGTWFFALASVLLLVPLQPYSGGILPVQLAMLTTRNIEYILFIVGLALVLRVQKLRTLTFASGVALLGLLAASDRLFVGLGLAGAVLMMAFGWLRQNRYIVHAAARLLAANALAAAVSVGALAALQVAGIFSESSSIPASPYQFIQSPSDAAVGIIYGILGILTNFGANPAFDAVVVRDIFGVAVRKLWSVAGIGYLINAAIAAFVAWRSWEFTAQTPKRPKKSKRPYPLAHLLSLALLSSAIVATALFIATKHYYAVDARYLTIWLFAGFVVAATRLRGVRLKRGRVAIIGLACLLVLPLSTWVALQTYGSQRDAYIMIDERNRTVASALDAEHIDLLVGDYWRVLPIKAVASKPLTVAPLGSCTDFRDSLTSSSWRGELTKRPVAYLLSLEKGLTDFPACNQTEVSQAFGQPSRTVIIAGTSEEPSELLLIYNRGFNHADQTRSLAAMPSPKCTTKTVLQIVAHPDDDLLFFSPDLYHDIQNGACLRTVYLTAGDSGGESRYWQERQIGIRAAYNTMLGNLYSWEDRPIRVKGGQELQFSSPVGAPQISLVFVNLPDGSPHGQGFSTSSNESLKKLYNSEIERVQTMDRRSTYTSTQLSETISELIKFYKPSELRTFAAMDPDHSDHTAVSNYVRRSFDQMPLLGSAKTALQTYLGYSVFDLEENVLGDDFIAKEQAFLSYGIHDGATCSDSETCMMRTAYGTYLTRQYRVE